MTPPPSGAVARAAAALGAGSDVLAVCVGPAASLADAAAGTDALVVDDADRVSGWGPGFDVRLLASRADTAGRGRSPVLAVARTSDPLVHRDVVARLGLREPVVVRDGGVRASVALEVGRRGDDRGARSALLERVLATDGPGVVHTATRRAAEELADELQSRRVPAVVGTGGRVDVRGPAPGGARFVHHLHASGSLPAYADDLAADAGDEAEAVMFFRPEDLELRRLHDGRDPTRRDVDALARALRRRGPLRDPAELPPAAGIDADRAVRVLALLADAGLLTADPEGVALADGPVDGAVEAALHAAQERAEARAARVEAVRAYAELESCRREFLLGALELEERDPCGRCDVCREGGPPPPADGGGPFAVGTRVVHLSWGEGTVQHVADGRIAVVFDEAGYRTLALELVRERGVLDAC